MLSINGKGGYDIMRYFGIIVAVASFVATYLYVKLVWGSWEAYWDACLIKSAIGVGCLLVILVATLIISKIKK